MDFLVWVHPKLNFSKSDEHTYIMQFEINLLMHVYTLIGPKLVGVVCMLHSSCVRL